MQSEYITQILQILQKVTKISGDASQSCQKELADILKQLEEADQKRGSEMNRILREKH
jgi:hypothetical protein